MSEIGRLRARIDQIDREILGLLKGRFESAKELGRIKEAKGLALRDPERERSILDSVGRLASRMQMDPRLARKVFRQVLSLSVQGQSLSSSRYDQTLAGFEVLVVGGTGRMGQFFTRFASARGASVKISGRDKSRTRRVAGELGVAPTDYRKATGSDIVIAAAPMEVIGDICLKAARLMKRGSLLTDISSVKTGISDRIYQGAPSHIEYISLHPLFGPDIDHVYGQNVLAVPYREGEMWGRFSLALKRAGARLHLTSAEAHDKTMAYAQGLHHFALISLGLGLTKWNGEYPTSSLRLTSERIRALLHNWDTVVGIQRANPFVSPARETFQDIVNGLVTEGFRHPGPTFRLLRSSVQKWSRKQ